MPLSVVVLAKNEEKNIRRAIESVDFADEVIVVDDFSEDKTAAVASRLGARVFKRHLGEDFAEQRNYGLKQAKGDWILFLDADEKVTSELRQEILLLDDRYSAYYVTRKNFFLGKQVGQDKILRIAKKGQGGWTRAVHEKWIIGGRIGRLTGAIIHEEGTLKEIVAKTNFYSTIHARQNAREGKTSSLFRIIFFPKAKFIENVLTGKGFVFGLIHSFHSFLAWSKQWIG